MIALFVEPRDLLIRRKDQPTVEQKHLFKPWTSYLNVNTILSERVARRLDIALDLVASGQVD